MFNMQIRQSTLHIFSFKSAFISSGSRAGLSNKLKSVLCLLGLLQSTPCDVTRSETTK